MSINETALQQRTRLTCAFCIRSLSQLPLKGIVEAGQKSPNEDAACAAGKSKLYYCGIQRLTG